MKEIEDNNVEETKEVKKETKKKKSSDQEKIDTLKELLKNSEEKAMRIQAEMMNFKRRKEEEVSNMYKYANEDILKSLISIVDNFERALKMETEENKDFLKGFYMIYTSIVNILSENGVTEIVADNVEFDPSIHQAVLTESVDGVKENTVIELLQKGYMYKDKVLRAAMVKVSC